MYTSAKTYGRNTYVGRIRDQEVDFILEKGKKKLFVQATYLLDKEDVIQREYQSLLDIPENWKKVVVSLDPYQHEVREGIEHIQAWRWEEMLRGE